MQLLPVDVVLMLLMFCSENSFTSTSDSESEITDSSSGM